MSTLPTVSVLIVNWNSKDLLRECLLSIRLNCADLSLQIVVVDGGSFDGCAEMLASEFPEVEFIQSKDNIGFGRANNLGLTRVTSEAVLVLNPDTEIQPGALQTLLSELVRRPDAGIVSPRLLNTDRTLQTSVHALPKPVRQALDSELLRRLLSPYSLWAPPSDFAPTQTVAVEAVAGTCMLMWTKTFREVGAFTPEYFMYAEDMDLCFKVLRAGQRIYHVPTAEVDPPRRRKFIDARQFFLCRDDPRSLESLLDHEPRTAPRLGVSLGDRQFYPGPNVDPHAGRAVEPIVVSDRRARRQSRAGGQSCRGASASRSGRSAIKLQVRQMVEAGMRLPVLQGGWIQAR